MDYYGLGPSISTDAVAAAASNVKASDNPPYTTGDFLAFYPQFGNNSQGVANMPIDVIQLYVDLAQQSIKQSRFYTSWKIAMAYFIAHFCTLWLRGTVNVDASQDAIAASGDVAGIITSESVDGVSYQIDVSSIMQDLEGFAMWKTTSFGMQLATLAKLYGKGGMVIR